MSFSAIICASQAASDSLGVLRANLHFAGNSLLEYQVRQAAEAGADQVMILVGAVTQSLSRAIDSLTADGISVSIVRDMVSLLREAPRDRDMLLVADGAIVPQRFYGAVAAQPGNVLLVTEDSATTARFERIDAGQRWAGLARVSPDVLFGTLDMIGDWDLELTLVRAVVQAGSQRIAVPAEDVMEARLALVGSQAEADLVSRALLAGKRAPAGEAGAERMLIAPLAARIAPEFLRSQVPAAQVRAGAIAVALIGIVATLLAWPMIALLLFLAAILLSLTVDRLVQLARRGGLEGWMGVMPHLIVLAGIALLGSEADRTMEGLYLAGLLAILMLGLRSGRFPGARKWAILTPGSALLILLVTTGGGYFHFGLTLAIACAILSLGLAVLGNESPES
ncbi:hypothetical protein [Sphingobium phenoxybenzoativorans]|uniref:hypothetical protein n=1 Tax=Sphingobium phenoxybenzoativorans TaxID=1592790 RepID=UPI0008722845|nr:hypothetical protein [Sphingobium phenoxybenzoativorans]